MGFAQRGPDGPLVHVFMQVHMVSPRRINEGSRFSPGPLASLWITLYQAPMRKTLFPHLGQVPFQAGLPFFMVTLVGFFISTFILSRTQ